ncbi:transposase domain-containing protein [Streptomyces gelaticus]|nr:transposase domain-containing protein [Streptomyces gelaticus]
MVYFVLATCLFSGQGYEEVARLLAQELERLRWWEKP